VYFSVPLAGVSYNPQPGNVFRCAVGGCPSGAEPFAPQQVATSLAVDSTSVYWAACTSLEYPCVGAVEIRTCPASGCANEPTTLATGLGHVAELVSDGSRLYWTQNTYGQTDGAVLSCPVTGCGASPDVVAQAQDSPGGIAVDDGFIYWVTSFYRDESRAGTIMRASK
jgi:hypothetical protein